MGSFRDLHRPGDPFVLINVWDAGTARMAVARGAAALATSSAAHAFSLGRPDGGHITRDEALAHAQALVAAVDAPVSGDFENGFGDDPETCAETVRLAAEVGLAGISIEDSALPAQGAYERDLAVERIRAAAAAARALPRDFVLVARADGVMTGAYDIEEGLARIRAFDAAGADCLYVPHPGAAENLSRVIAATDKPVNVLALGPWSTRTRAEFAQMGAARISIGGGLARIALGAVDRTLREVLDEGGFGSLTDAMPGAEIEALIASGRRHADGGA